MLKSRLKRWFSPAKSDVQQLLTAANSFPRYKETEISFRGMKIRVTDHLSVAWQLIEFFEDGRMKFSTSKKDPLIYDCGSNVGVSVLYYKQLYPGARIKAFEPDPKVYACLANNIQQNQLKNVELFQKAIWKDDQGIEFGSEGADGGSVFHSGNKIRLETVRLKSLLQSEQQVDLLKMDIEGAEVEVLKDCMEELRKVRYLFVEYHSWKGQKQELDVLLKILSDAGFRYYIHSIGETLKQPFVSVESSSSMDIQLDIHAVNGSAEN